MEGGKDKKGTQEGAHPGLVAAHWAQSDKIGSGKAAKEGHGGQSGVPLVAASRANKKPRLERRWSHPPKLNRKTAGGEEKAPREHPSRL